mgnify:FL=1
MSDVEIGRGKRGRVAYSFDDVSLVPSRRTREASVVSLAWKIDAYTFEHPIIAAPMDSVVSPESAVGLSSQGGLAILNLEGLWTRYADAQAQLDAICAQPAGSAIAQLQRLYAAPIDPDLIQQRVADLRAAGITVAGSLSPHRTLQLAKTVVDAGVDLFVIRGTTVSAEHVSNNQDALNLKEFIYQLDVPVIVGGCATYTSALHLMRTGAAGVLVGFGGGAAHTTANVLGVRVPMAKIGRAHV